MRVSSVRSKLPLPAKRQIALLGGRYKMKSPRILFAVFVLSIACAITIGCGGGGSSSHFIQPVNPPPPPTGTNYTTCSDNGGGSQLVPNWQSPLFINNYQAATQALIQHVSQASYASKIGYIRIGLGRGGEINLPQGWNDSTSGSCYGGYSGKWGYTVGGSAVSSSTWNTYLSDMVTFEHGLQSPNPLLVSITPVSGAGNVTDDFIAPIAVQNGLSYGNQGLQASDITAFSSGGQCGGDWCNLFENSAPAIKELQTIGQSCPQGVGACSGQQGETGPLPPLLQFATGQGTPVVPSPSNDLEIYYQDWLIAYDPTNSDNGTYGAAYASALAAASANATMQVLFPDPSNSDIQTYVLTQPSVAGVVIDVDWSDIQPSSSSSFDWTITDSLIQQWIGAGAKKVNLVFQNTTYGGDNCSGGSGVGSQGQSSSGNCAMPAWMWTVLQ